jgi:(2Fe-2S) ferredoxin
MKLKAERDGEQIVKPKIRDYSRQVLICTGPRCTQNGEGEALFNALQAKFRAAGLGVDAGPDRVKRTRTGCVAACQGGPIVAVQPDGVWYYNVSAANMDRIIDEHLKNGRVVEDLVFHRNGKGD